MNIYQKKQRWKWVLFLTAIAIVGVSLFYTNHLVQKLSTEERRKVKLWADAIKEKAELNTQLGEGAGLAKECAAAIITEGPYPEAYTVDSDKKTGSKLKKEYHFSAKKNMPKMVSKKKRKTMKNHVFRKG